MNKRADTSNLLFQSSEWNFNTLYRTYDAIKEIALDELGLDVYPNQLEIISSEQMLDAYSSNGMPLIYRHWSFGKHFVYEEHHYRKGHRGLAYELVINSNPCITYLMEENTMAMQTLVTAHAAFGHNHFFKNNYLFRQWTDADAILNYMEFAKNTSPNARNDTASLPWRRSSIPPMHSWIRRVPLSPPAANSSEKAGSGSANGWNTRSEPISDLWRTLPQRKPKQDPTKPNGTYPSARRPQPAGGKPSLFHREEQPHPRAMAAGDPAHRSCHRPIFLSAAPDKGDERGMRHVRALHDHEYGCSTRGSSAKAIIWKCCTAIPTSYSSPGSMIHAFPGSTLMPRYLQ